MKRIEDPAGPSGETYEHNGHPADGIDLPATESVASSHVAIIGLGLMGGSLALALKAAGHHGTITGIARRRATIELALRLGAIDEGREDFAALRDADLVVLATPVRVILRQIAQAAPYLKPGSLVIDLGSTKQEICAALDRLPDHVQVLGGHPMCGKETSGLEVADAALYRDKTFVLCPCARSTAAATATGLALVAALGARPLILDPARHDRLVAAISHLPYLISLALVTATEAAGRREPQVWDVAASGFRDTSRLAASDADMMLDILLTNRTAVLSALATYRSELDALADLLARHDEAGLRTYLAQGRQRRLHFAAAHLHPQEPGTPAPRSADSKPQGEPA